LRIKVLKHPTDETRTPQRGAKERNSMGPNPVSLSKQKHDRYHSPFTTARTFLIFLGHSRNLTKDEYCVMSWDRSMSLVHNISYRMKEFAAWILISYQFQFNHTFNHIPSASAHFQTN